jgi:hypothetical protein
MKDITKSQTADVPCTGHPKGKLVFPKSTCATAANPFFQLMIAAVVQVSKLVWKLKTLRLSHSPTPSYGSGTDI